MKPTVAELRGHSLADDDNEVVKAHVIRHHSVNNIKYVSVLLPGWVNGLNIDCLLDCGSTVTIISRRMFELRNHTLSLPLNDCLWQMTVISPLLGELT